MFINNDSKRKKIFTIISENKLIFLILIYYLFVEMLDSLEINWIQFFLIKNILNNICLLK